MSEQCFETGDTRISGLYWDDENKMETTYYSEFWV